MDLSARPPFFYHFPGGVNRARAHVLLFVFLCFRPNTFVHNVYSIMPTRFHTSNFLRGIKFLEYSGWLALCMYCVVDDVDFCWMFFDMVWLHPEFVGSLCC